MASFKMLTTFVAVAAFVLFESAYFAEAGSCDKDCSNEMDDDSYVEGYPTCGDIHKKWDKMICLQNEAVDSSGEECECTCGMLRDNCDKPNDQSNNGNSGGNDADDGGNGDSSCFHGSTVVQTPTGPMRLDQLAGRTDVDVLSADATTGRVAFSKVQQWIHIAEDVETNFIHLETETGQSLLLTPTHLIHVLPHDVAPTDVQSWVTKQARNVVIGDQLMTSSNQQKEWAVTEVKGVTQERHTGIYAPITESGHIVVNDVLASCFMTLEDTRVIQLMLQSVQTIRSILPIALDHALFQHSDWLKDTTFGSVMLNTMSLLSKN